MKMNLLCSAISGMMFLSACSSRAASDAANENHTSKVMIEGKESNDYYNQFLARTDGSCAKGSVWFRFLSIDSVLLSKNSSGNDIRAELRIFMSADHTYRAIYQEQEVFEYTELGYKYQILEDKKLAGRWSVESDHIMFEGIGAGSALTYNEKPTIALDFTHDIRTAGLNGKSTLAHYVVSSAGEESYNQYCAHEPHR